MKRAFTLIELLMAMGIIAILAVLLLPALTGAKRSARRAACINNLRQINLATRMYADDHGDAIRAATNKEALYFTYKASLRPYLSQMRFNSENAVFACPADDFNCDDPVIQNLFSFQPPVSGRSFHRQQTTHYSSYFFNGAAPNESESEQHMGQKPFSTVHEPTRVVLVGELSGAFGLSAHERKEPHQFNNTRNVMSFVDGHVNFIPIYWNGVRGFDGIAYFYEPPSGYDYKWSDN